MTKYIALSFVSGLLMQTAVLADEVKTSSTEVRDGNGSSSSASVSSKKDLDCAKTNCTKSKMDAPSVQSKRSESYSNDGAVEQKETKTETNVNP